MGKKYQRVLVTGCTGFLGRQVTQEFLSRGYFVRGTTRSSSEQHQSILGDFDAGEALELHTLDLTLDEGWSEAMDGIDAVIHTASPFSAYEPKDEMELIGPARDGTIRVLNKAYASGIRKFVITSSTAAISGATPTTKNQTYTEQDWTDIDKDVSAYTKSKTLAEQAARDFASKHDDVQLTTVNPNVIFGPLHSGRSGTSLRIIESIVKSSYPGFPKISFAPVDVRDVAWMHAEALERDELDGERLMMASTPITMPQIARYLKSNGYKVRTMALPNIVVKVMAIFIKEARLVTRGLGTTNHYDCSNTIEKTGWKTTNHEEMIVSAAKSLGFQ
ncbi:MAG: NAD-dependent epimerase/dehydratase family protein [Candidatus Thermoplasmatota archaeon]|nr:NAD-dependent epimerase/dehydratase family protein [Candidatus Thermoplasmatota archaeon]